MLLCAALAPCEAAPAADLPPAGAGTAAYTHQRLDGNRVSQAVGGEHFAELELALDLEPAWLVALPRDAGSVWVVAHTDGSLHAALLSECRFRPATVRRRELSPGQPFMVRASRSGDIEIVADVLPDASRASHAVPIAGLEGSVAYVSTGGEVALRIEGRLHRIAVGALPDARLIGDGRGNLLVLGGASGRYAHGVLGDAIEATTINVIETRPAPRLARRIELPANVVVEGIAPMWVDLTGDGEREIVVTLSDAAEGARIVAFDGRGRRVAEGPAVGSGFRWRHQIALAPFGPSGEIELVAVRTPHIGGVVEFYALTGRRLDILASLGDYSSHRIGSANLDTAVAADVDADGRFELLSPTVNFDALAVIAHRAGGARESRRFAAGAAITTNIAAVAHANGRLAIGVGTRGPALRVWLAVRDEATGGPCRR